LSQSKFIARRNTKKFHRLMRGARVLVSTCTDVQPGEQVLVVTDEARMSIAEAVAEAARERGGDAVIAVMSPRSADAQEPPPTIAEAMKHADVIFTPVSISITHTNAMKQATARGARGAMLTAYTEGLLMSQALQVDFHALASTCIQVAQRLTDTDEALLTTPAGTHLSMSLKGRKGNALTCVVGKGEFSPIPNIEANIVPIEGTAKGIIVVDASIPYLGIGIIRKPITLSVDRGQILRIEDGGQAQVLQEAWRVQRDPNVYNVAELGIGLNPKARMTGVMLADEGVYGTVHIGSGTSINLGGTVKAASHYDLIMWKPTLILDGQPLLKGGKLVLRAPRLDVRSLDS